MAHAGLLALKEPAPMRSEREFGVPYRADLAGSRNKETLHSVQESSREDSLRDANILDGAEEEPKEYVGPHESLEARPAGGLTGTDEAFDVFQVSGDVNYKNMSPWHVGALMIAETISLGILSLPSAMAAMGFFPGLTVIVALGLLATYTGYVIGQFKLKYPAVVSMADAGAVLFGPIGRHVFGVASTIMIIFFMAAHILTFSIMMNVLTSHATCSIVFGFVGFVVCMICTLPRTLKNVSYMSIVSFFSIASAVMITMIALGVTKKGGKESEMIVRNASFSSVVLGILDLVMAYAGNVAFFGFISELRDPRTYPQALYMLQACAISFYAIVASVIYYYAGANVPSPALGATSPVVQKIAYSFAIPTIVVAGVINGHIAVKYVYVSIFRKRSPETISANTFKAYGSWIAINFTLWLLSWAVAEAIPNFNQLLGFVSALFGTWFTYGVSGGLWLHMNKGQYTKTWKKKLLFVVNIGCLLFAGTLCGLGLYVSGSLIKDGSTGTSFSCEDNSIAH